MSDHFHIPMEDLMAIEVQLANKPLLDALAKSFQYDEALPLHNNLKALAAIVANYLRVEGRTRVSLVDWFAEKNMPIEVTLRPLRGEQLQGILEEWASLHSESSTIIEKLYSNNHRNILFKRVLFEQKEAIDDYFKTLSDKEMLKGVDLYQVLVDILSPYFLYDRHADSETFFEKVNSLDTFIDVVNRFVHCEKRISVGINPQNADYIRRFQFERLIEFWEGENEQLILLSERRKNHIDQQTQTEAGNTHHQAIQTDRSPSCVAEIIQETLRLLNRLTPDNDSVQELQAIQRIYSFLRRQKILQLQENSPLVVHREEELDRHSQKTEKKANSPTSRLFANSNGKMQAGILASLVQRIAHNETVGSIEQEPNREQEHELLKEPLTPKAEHPKEPPLPKTTPKLASILRGIYSIYFTYQLDIGRLEKCLLDISVDKKDMMDAINVITQGRHKESLRVYYQDFETTILRVMSKDHCLTEQVLNDFLKAKLDEQASCLYRPLYSPSSALYSRTSHLSSPYFRY